ncbi:MAG: DUF2336 domain-containing protein [Pseudorhodoplanes sp.]|uniref:DUF2336 domain-containing protein n=1 Tax=Pseudorhodoplanes sp. TaxID=1934341 RepID=UPI003D13C70E
MTMSDTSSLIQELEQAIAAGSSARRLDALTRITDLFLAGSGRHSQEQIALFDDILMVLIDTIEVNARVQLSRRLAPRPDAPEKVVRMLAFDDSIAVAAPVLIRSERLTDNDLVRNAGCKSQDHLQAITQRRTLSEPVTDALIERGNARIIHLVVKNAGARFSEAGFGKLVSRAVGDDGLARNVGARRDIPRHHFLKLLENASAEVRARLIASNPRLMDVVDATVADIAACISDDVRNSSRDHARAVARVKRLHRTGQFSEADLHAYASAHDFERASVALAALGEFPIDLVERALIDRSTDLILILARAAQCSRVTVRAVLTMRTADRGLSPMDLAAALAQFDRLQLSTARSALEFYRLRRQADDKPNVPTNLTLEWYADSIPARPGQAGG